jgi:hypothetical protein
MLQVIVFPQFLVTVMSVRSSRVMRLRSRCGVAGSFQIAGKSVTSLRMRVFWVSASSAVAAFWAVSQASWASLSARSAVFQPASRVSATSRLAGPAGQVAAAGQAGVVAGALDGGGA